MKLMDSTIAQRGTSLILHIRISLQAIVSVTVIMPLVGIEELCEVFFSLIPAQVEDEWS